jgi:signal transduction histidine kinase/CheY-like chemotaxis protein
MPDRKNRVQELETGLIAARTRIAELESTSEEALRAGQARFRQALENIPDVVVIYDRRLCVQFMNCAGTRGGSGPFEAALGSEAYQQCRREIRAAFSTGNPRSLELSPGRRHILMTCVPLQDRSGRITEVMTVTRDLTEQKQIEEGLRQRAEELEKLMDLVPAAIWVARDRECRIITGNSTANEFYEAQRGENVSAGPAPGEPVPPRRFFSQGRELAAEELPMQRAAALGIEVRNTELDVLLPSGHWLSIWGSASPLRDADGCVRGCLGAFTDITERKQNEKAVEEAKELLEQKVKERTAELSQAIDVLQMEVRQRLEAEACLKEAYEKLNVRADQLRALAGELTLTEQRERRRLARILHDHLQQLLVGAKFRVAILARMGDELICEAAMEIKRLLDESIAASRSLTAELSPPILQEGGLEAGLLWLTRWMRDKHSLAVDLRTIDGLPQLSSDLSALLFESVRELLFNAVKHGQVLSATVSVRRIRGNRLQVSVSDEGCGFNPAEVRPAVAIGEGFGLFSIRERIALFGGSMEISSAPGEGARVVLTVPFEPHGSAGEVETRSRKGVAAVSTGPVMTGRRIRVLLADDHAVVREGLARMLDQEADIEIAGEAVDGQQAVEMARQLQPDIILMDVSMPRLNGVEATRIISREFPEIRIIGLSMFDDSDRAQAMRDAGAADYLMKSDSSAGLFAAIRSVAFGNAIDPGTEKSD